MLQNAARTDPVNVMNPMVTIVTPMIIHSDASLSWESIAAELAVGLQLYSGDDSKEYQQRNTVYAKIVVPGSSPIPTASDTESAITKTFNPTVVLTNQYPVVQPA